MTAQFNIKHADPRLVAHMQSTFGLPRFVAATMVAHGVTTDEQAQAFLNPDILRDWRNPYEIPQMKEAADRLEAAIRDHERIVVFGDFDLDGISATTVLTRAIKALGGDVEPFIPSRFTEGYGITHAALQRVWPLEPKLIVTVDCGISCREEVKEILAAGVDVVVTDHHEPGEDVPEGVVVSDPKCGDGCPSSILAGVGVALKLAQCLGARFGRPNLWRDFTDLAALGTLGDLMPLVGENRALVADGLARMNEHPRPSIAALKDVCRVADQPLTSTNLSFSLIPRLNAAGRMGNAELSLRLLLEDDFAKATELAGQLDAVNDERRSIEADLAVEAKAQAEQVYHGQRALVVSGEGWHDGVKGIVVSRLVSAYGVPTILFTIDGDQARGSGRSVGQVNLYDAVASTSDILTRFGGHRAAVGVTLPTDKLPEFTERLCAYMDQLPEESFHPLIEIDACVGLDELTMSNVEQMERLAPFGQENPTPRFLARNVRLVNCRAVGAEKNHLSCGLTDGAHTVSGIMFHCASIESLMSCGGVVDAVFEVQIDEWRGRRKVKCMLQSIEPAFACPALQACLPPDDMEFVGELFDEWNAADDESSGAPGAASDSHASSADAEGAMAEASGAARGVSHADAVAQRRAQWAARAHEDPEDLEDALIEALIGDGALHKAQRQALDALASGLNTMAVMGTGRGKSLIFQIHAARIALAKGQVSLFIYPLRALIADQCFHMANAFAPFGLSVVTLTGESSAEERANVMRGLSEGTVDIVLSTPEYMVRHVDEVARATGVERQPDGTYKAGRIRFMVIDEAHHLVQRGYGAREAYTRIGDVAARLGNPTVLALTATAPGEVARTAVEGLDIKARICDDAERANLRLDDQRGLRDKDSYLAGIIASGEKTIVYVNSRVGTVDLARTMRTMVPQLAMQIGFYNAGMSRAERIRIERLFRDDVLRVLMVTSAFGEGINIPDVRHMVLYSMPFSDVEFNQISGRAGRDGKPATIHMLFGKNDANASSAIIHQMAPSHDDMAQVYRELKAQQRAYGTRCEDGRAVASDDGYFSVTYEELAQACNRHATRDRMTADACACSIAVFDELGLIDTCTCCEEGTSRIHIRDVGEKVSLTDSVLYREGLGQVQAFEHFSTWSMQGDADEMRSRLIAPMLPDDADDAGDAPTDDRE